MSLPTGDSPWLAWTPGAVAGPAPAPGTHDAADGTAGGSGVEVVGLGGLLARGLRRAAWAAVPGSAVDGGRGIRWPRREQRDSSWWPQGIDVREVSGATVLAVSWHHQVGGIDTAARVTFIDVRGARPRFAHVVLVEAVDGVQRPIAIHAGGLAWYGDLLHVADTFGGVRVFDVRHIVRHRRSFWRRDEYSVSQSGAYTATTPEGQRRMRYSFLSLEHDAAGPRLVAGEYRSGAATDARLLRLPLGGHTPDRIDVHAPGIARMQGVCIVDGAWYVTTSNGPHRGGDLLVGQPDALVRHPSVLPPGPEDLAHQPGTSRLWSVTEHPGRRWVFAIDLEAIDVTAVGAEPVSPSA